MDTRRLGKTDMDVSILGFGGAEIGYQRVGKKYVSDLLNNALDAGLNVIDTAECYGNSENLIGETVGSRRNEFYIFTKCGHPDGPGKENWNPISLFQTIQDSLKRLKIDYLDLLQLHSCSEKELRNGDVIDILNQARTRGYTRYIGYSGDSNAAQYAVECGQFDTLQTSVSIADQEALELTLPLAREHSMGVIAKRPIANAAWRSGKKPEDSYQHEYWSRLQKLKYEFLNTNLKESISKALRFTVSVSGVHTAIVGTSNPKRWHENANIINTGQLPQEEFNMIRARWQRIAKANWIGQI